MKCNSSWERYSFQAHLHQCIVLLFDAIFIPDLFASVYCSVVHHSTQSPSSCFIPSLPPPPPAPPIAISPDSVYHRHRRSGQLQRRPVWSHHPADHWVRRPSHQPALHGSVRGGSCLHRRLQFRCCHRSTGRCPASHRRSLRSQACRVHWVWTDAAGRGRIQLRRCSSQAGWDQRLQLQYSREHDVRRRYWRRGQRNYGECVKLGGGELDVRHRVGNWFKPPGLNHGLNRLKFNFT